MRMTRISCSVSLVVVTFLWMMILVRGETEVSCVFMERCILPCSFQLGREIIIHWIELRAGEPRVHSFYNDQDQLGHQDQNFRGRTSLFKDQISRGNASLLLTGVKVQDEGRYKCHTSTITGNKESFINLKVDAPLHEVNIVQEGNRITCSSNWIYPEPELTWSTTPPSKETFKNTTTVQQTEQQLYNISSSLILSDSDSDLVYSCTISTGTNKRRNQRRATFRRLRNSVNVGLIGGAVAAVAVVFFASVLALVLYWKHNRGQPLNTTVNHDISRDPNQSASRTTLLPSNEDDSEPS